MKKIGNSVIVNFSLFPHQLEEMDRWCYRLKMSRSEFIRKAAKFYILNIKADQRMKEVKGDL